MEAVIAPILVGTLVGVVVGTLGGGGGVQTVPILVYLLHQDPHAAAASSQVIVGVTSLAALVPHARAGNVRWRAGTGFALLAVVATLGGTAVSLLVDGVVLMAAFAGLLLVVSWLMIRKATSTRGTTSRRDGPAPRRRVVRVVMWSTIVGLLTGFFGVGGGFAVVPALTLALGFSMRAAVGT